MKRAVKKSIERTLYFFAWTAPLPVWLTVFFLGPVLLLFWLSFWDVRNFSLIPGFYLKSWVKVLTADYFWAAYFRTIQLAFLAAVLSSIIALPCALSATFFFSLRARLMFLALTVLPFFTSFVVRIYSWQIYLVENGVFNKFLGLFGIPTESLLNSKFAILIGYVTLTLPIVIVIQSVSLLSMNKTLINAGYNLGCGPARILTSVILPSAKPGIVIGFLFAFIFSFGDFVSPTYLGGGKFITLSILIADTVKSGQQWPRAAVVAVVMILTLLATAVAGVLFAYRRR